MVISQVMQSTSINKSIVNRFCRRIELDFDNERQLRSLYPHVAGKTSGGIKQIEVESIQECISRERYGQPARYRYLGTRYVYRVEDEHEFFLLLIETGIEYKDIGEVAEWLKATVC